MASWRERLRAAAGSPSVLLAIYVLVAVGVTVHKLALGPFESRGLTYAPLQNFAIFRNSFPHLLAGQDLYAAFPAEQWDLFKYTPTFALFMAPFAALPYGAGAVLWNVVNALALFGAVAWLPSLDRRAKVATLWFVLVNLVSSMQGAQSNGLVAGLMLAGFAARERGRDTISAASIVAAAFVKPFGAVAVLPCLLQPRRVRWLAWVAAWSVALAVVPLVLVSPQQLWFLYGSWFDLLRNDHSVKVGTSIMSWLRAWFGLDLPKNLVVGIGAVLLVVPVLMLFRRGGRAPARPADTGIMPQAGSSAAPASAEPRFQSGSWIVADPTLRVLVMASVLIWVVIFNHMAEPPTYVIAMTGVALWYFSRPPITWRTALVVFTFLFTAGSASDIYPPVVRKQFISPFVMRAAGCIFVWVALQLEMGAPRRGAPTD
jgi:hypothetical protein